MTVHGSGEQVDAVLAQLRAEEPFEQDDAQQALLHHECGVLEEARGDEAAATREYLAAHDSDPSFREPLHALVRIYGRRHEQGDLPRFLEMLIDAEPSSSDSVSARWQLASFRQTVEDDLAGARTCIEEALENDAQDVACWLELEFLAARDDDGADRLRALQARAGLTTNPTWQGLLLIELAELCAEAGELERATQVLDEVAGIEGKARFRSRLCLERLAREAGDNAMQAQALESQAELIIQASEDSEFASAAGVPSFVCDAEHAVDAWMRAAELRRRQGDAWGAVAALSAAAERIPDEPLVARLAMAAADAAGDSEAAVRIAREQLARGGEGPTGAILWLRIGRAAEAAQDAEAALRAYGEALQLDPSGVPAHVFRADLLTEGDDPTLLAETLQQQAEAASSQEAKARAWIVAAYVWGVRAGDVERARSGLDAAVRCGTEPRLAALLGRSFASLCEDEAWYAKATARLLEVVEDASERQSLQFELGRSRLLCRDGEGAAEAFLALAGISDDASPEAGRWLGRALSAYVVGQGPRAARSSESLARLAEVESEPQLSKGLMVVATLLAAQKDAGGEVIEPLVAQHRSDPADLVLALLVAGIRRAGADTAGAAAVLSDCAAAQSEADLAGALRLEAGLLLWEAGDRSAAIDVFEQAIVDAPQAAQLVLSWALRGASPDDPAVRLRAVQLAGEADGDLLAAALEELAQSLASRDAESDDEIALSRLDDLNPGGDIALMTALGWLVGDTAGTPAAEPALEQLEQLGGAAAGAAFGERFRIARFVDRDVDESLQRAAQWHEAEPSTAAALEWLAGAFAADDAAAEVAARNNLSAHLSDDAADAVAASAALVETLRQPGAAPPLLRSGSVAARMTNLELALPGCEPNRRSAALGHLGDALGDDAALDARLMRAWSLLAAGSDREASEAFRALTEERGSDLSCWEGLREAAQRLGDQASVGIALAQLGNLSRSDDTGAELWERAGLVLQDEVGANDDAEIAYQRSLERDKSRPVAFDRLFRLVRARKDNDQLLQLISLRLDITDDEAETTKMYWERARVYRDKGDTERALQCLNDVTLLEPEHVGALTLASVISMKKQNYEEAAPMLARLATIEEAPKKQRLSSGVLAVDLYEKKLGQPEKALEILRRLYEDGLSTLKVRERLARAAARLGRWDGAVAILHELMEERASSSGRAEAARLAMAIYRDKLDDSPAAVKAITRLFEEEPADREAIAMLLTGRVSDPLSAAMLPKARGLLLDQLAAEPFDREAIGLVAEIAGYEGRSDLQRVALGCLVALGDQDLATRRTMATIDGRAVREPQIVLAEAEVAAIADDDDGGPVGQLFKLAAGVIAEAMGPSLKSEKVGRRDRAAGGDPMRTEIARWMGALGFGEFEVYVGGRSPQGVCGVAGDKPAVIVGPELNAQLDDAGRAAVAREIFALRRGSTAVLHCDDHTIFSIVVAIAKDAGVSMPDPPYAVFKEVERVIRKAMSRKVRKTLVDVCQEIARSKQDAHVWAAAARRSIDRMALLATSDAPSVIDQICGRVGTPERLAIESDERARRLLSFALSSEYLQLRTKLGMGVA